ncbi:MAG: Two-component sensor histidine kinase [Myxococcaceae bacterium]|nr:Two-component sensor histidine kinase [Myxococcaceae bacterium]
MNPAFALSLVAAVVGVLVALLSLLFGSAPGWRQYRTFALVAASAAFFCACDGAATIGMSHGSMLALTHVQNAVGALHCAAWAAYIRRRLGKPSLASDDLARNALFVVATLWLLPVSGLMLTGVVVGFDLGWLGRYEVVQATTLGSLSFALLLATLLLSLVRYARGARRGFRDTLLHVVAIGSIVVAAVSDALVASGVLHLPFVLSLAFLGAVGAIGIAFTSDFVVSARAMERFSGKLETMVEKRTAELLAAESALLRAEKMAAVGQLAAGVAHEINNPAAALAANLAYLNEGLVRGKLPADARECLDESEEAVARIAKIVTQLLDSGREIADPAHPDPSVRLLPVVETALAMAKARIGSHVTTSVDIDAALAVRADEASLGQVLLNVIINAAQAIPRLRPGRIAIRAVKEGDRVRLEIKDNGAGMSAETERRMFEPFFTTRPHGEGQGLGLAVSLGIIRSMDGELKASTSPAGTVIQVVLGAGKAVAISQTAVTAAPAVIKSVLVVDDDVAVARAVRRLLGSTMTVEVATTVGDALAKLLEQPYDVILSDLQMPGGGGRWLYEELLTAAPGRAQRVIFFSGGSPSAPDAELIASHGIPFLPKPLVIDDFIAAARRVVVAAASSSAA